MPSAGTTSDHSDGQAKVKIFISYSRKDAAFVERLEAGLSAHRFEPLVDRSEIFAFEDWWQRIEALIAQADTVVFVLSPDAVASEICTREVAFAQSLNKRLAPVVLKRVDPERTPKTLANLNFIFFDSDDAFPASMDRLVNALGTDIAWVRKHTEFGELAQRWGAVGVPGPRGLLLRSPLLDEAETWIANRPQYAPLPTTTTRAYIIESRRTATQRRNVFVGALVASLVVAVGLTALSLWQRGIATDQLAIAEAESTRAVKNAQVAGTASSALIANSRADLDRARRSVTSNPDNLQLQRTLLINLGRLGSGLMIAGDRVGALQSYREGLNIARTLAVADPNNPMFRVDVGMFLSFVAEVLSAQGDGAGAIAALRECLGVRRALVAQVPGNQQIQNDLVVALFELGVAKDSPRDRFTEALTILKRMKSEKSLTAEQLRNIDIIEQRLAKL